MGRINAIEKPARYYSEIAQSIMKIDPYAALFLAHKAQELAPEDSSYLYHLATLYRRIGDFENAEYFIKKAIDSDPYCSHYTKYFCFILIDRGNFKECRDLIKKMIGINDREGEYYHLMALCHAYEGNIPATIENGKISVSLNPKYNKYKKSLYILNKSNNNKLYFIMFTIFLKIKRSIFAKKIINLFYRINNFTRFYKLFYRV